MNVQPIDTLSAQREALTACSAEVFEKRVMQPLEPFWKPFLERLPQQVDDGASPAMTAATMMGCYTPDEDCKKGLEAIEMFETSGTWQACVEAANKALEAFYPAAHGLDLAPIHFTLVLGSLRMLDLKYGAYTGAQQPGAALVMGYPNPVGTPRLPVASAHEINHIVRFAFEPFMPGLTLGKYLVAEGLAESFGLGVVGDKTLVGPYSTALSSKEVAKVKPRFKEALEESDFDVVRGFIFGDWAAEKFRYPKQNIPDFAGYTLGFNLVQAYLARTGRSAAAATYVSWKEIVEASGYF